jgi:hypothetical protein
MARGMMNTIRRILRRIDGKRPPQRLTPNWFRLAAPDFPDRLFAGQ